MRIAIISSGLSATTAGISQIIGISTSSISVPTTEKCLLRFDPSKVLLARLIMKTFPCSDRFSSATMNLISQVVQKLSTPPSTGTKWRFTNTEVNSINQLLNTCQESAVNTQMQAIMNRQPSACTTNPNDTGIQDNPNLPNIGN